MSKTQYRVARRRLVHSRTSFLTPCQFIAYYARMASNSFHGVALHIRECNVTIFAPLREAWPCFMGMSRAFCCPCHLICLLMLLPVHQARAETAWTPRPYR